MNGDRIEMSQRERDRLKVMATVLEGSRTQPEAARLLKRCVRQVRRIQRRLESEGDQGVVSPSAWAAGGFRGSSWPICRESGPVLGAAAGLVGGSLGSGYRHVPGLYGRRAAKPAEGEDRL